MQTAIEIVAVSFIHRRELWCIVDKGVCIITLMSKFDDKAIYMYGTLVMWTKSFPHLIVSSNLGYNDFIHVWVYSF